MIATRIEYGPWDGAYTVSSCSICGREEASTLGRTPDMGNCFRLIQEWDGTVSTVHVSHSKDGVVLDYGDGVVHKVSPDYYRSILLK